LVSNDIIGKEFTDWLATMNLEIEWVEFFYLGTHTNHVIHCDSAFMGVGFGKINYVFGGQDSKMAWYKPKGKNTGEIQKTKAGTTYRTIDPNELVKTHDEHLEGFCLVNVSEFHTVWTKNFDRYCLSAYVKDSNTKIRVNFNQLQEKLKSYIP
jgi:hypothetical protein